MYLWIPATVLQGLGLYFILSGVFQGLGDPEGGKRIGRGNFFIGVGDIFYIIQNVMDHAFIAMWLNSFLAAIAFWAWWKWDDDWRNKMKKKTQELGDKSRQKIRKMTETMTPSPIPSPTKA